MLIPHLFPPTSPPQSLNSYLRPMKYLDELNEPQREAVTHVNGPLMIIAGAGSGKTKVLTTRITHLMAAHQVDSFNILALTFTNKAAAEMKERVERILGNTEAREMSAICTSPDFNGRGYARRLTAQLSNETLAAGQMPCTLGITGNTSSAAKLRTRTRRLWPSDSR